MPAQRHNAGIARIQARIKQALSDEQYDHGDDVTLDFIALIDQKIQALLDSMKLPESEKR